MWATDEAAIRAGLEPSDHGSDNESSDSSTSGRFQLEEEEEDEEQEEGELTMSFEDEEQEQQNVVRQPALEFSETFSKQGKSLLYKDGFSYKYEALSKLEEGIEYWKCNSTSRAEEYCKARIHVNTAWIERGQQRYKTGKFACNDHNHAAAFTLKQVVY